ncbi:uncharacterized protein LOC129791530 [Lutzomyia longipalpis]|uniref:uncharacterized protein LOC129791530 n=1 Tax=Lutzomyia longipalpis TaxID=7200 RepID=UPI0024833D3B|nr:uncharacterized protein LOC129791530 [Lutzomyia longipalpis]
MPGRSSQRAAYKGQFTTLKKDVNEISRNPDCLLNEGMIETLLYHRQSLESIERKYCEVQRAIIDETKPEDAKRAEQEELDNFLNETTHTGNQINRFIAKLQATDYAPRQPTASGGSTSDFSAFLTLMEKQLEEQKEQRLQTNTTIERMVGEMNRLSSSINANNGGPTMMGNPNETFTVTAPPRRKLDVIKIQPFSGDYTEWKTFKDLFESIIGNDDTLTKSEKMQYLKTLIVGEAQPIIESLKVCDENYDVAWTILSKEFDSAAPIVASYMKDFFALPAVASASVQGIQNLQRKSNSILQALDAMEVTSRDPFIIYSILQKLDEETRALWAGKVKENCPTWEQFNEFLVERSFQLRMSLPEKSYKSQTHPKKSLPTNKKPKMNSTSLAATEKKNCEFCKLHPHKLFRCKKFIALDGMRRLAAVKELKVCENCLSDNHKVEHCSYSLCNICNGKHNRLLHDAIIIATTTIPTPGGSQGQTGNPVNLICKNVTTKMSKVLLATVMIRIVDSSGEQHLCRAILDCGSQVNMISARLCQLLHLKKKTVNLSIEGVGTSSQSAQHVADVVVRPRMMTSSYSLPMTCIVMKRVTSDQPNWDTSSLNFQIPKHFQLADPNWQETHPIDLLIGGQFFCDIMTDDTHVLGPHHPVMKNTVFGWVLMGPCYVGHNDSQVVSCNTATMESIDTGLRRFWELEEISVGSPRSLDQDKVEELYRATTTRDQDGRYVVLLPFKDNMEELGNNRASARRQLFLLEARLRKNPELRAQYNQIFEEYLEKGFIEVVPYDQLNRPCFYMPHHCVIKEDAVSTKVRIVFNGSSPSESGLSLNDKLMVGATVQPPLLKILLNLRRHPVAFTCDIVKMYLQTILYEPHRDYQRFLWETESDHQVKDFRFRTVCFGVSASPYLATRSLIQLALDEGHRFPIAAKLILNNFYIDDCLVSMPTIEEALEAKRQLIALLALAKLELSKFRSTHMELTPSSDENYQLDMPSEEQVVKTLGMSWCLQTDMFQYTVNEFHGPATKRNMLSILGKIYDPMGLVCPITTVAKCILQDVWKLSMDWDTEIDGDLEKRWKEFMNTLPSMEDLRIPRWISNISEVVHQELHCFGDASKRAHGACIYLVTQDAAGNRCSRLYAAKSKINPISYEEKVKDKIKKKDFTIPKGELCGAVLAMKLASTVSDATEVQQIYFWLDATAVLHQIHNPTQKREVFVRNKVKKILDETNCQQWRHVGTKSNPADLASRGATPQQLISAELWWHGPEWLLKSEENWPPKFNAPNDDGAQVETSLALTTDSSEKEKLVANPIFEFLLAQFSSYSKIRLVLARCLQLVEIWKSSKVRVTRNSRRTTFSKFLHVKFLRDAEKLLIQWDQQQHFSHVLDALTNGSLETNASLRHFGKLRPFLDSEGTLRVGGRLSKSTLNYDTKHPKILPKSLLSRLIAEREHLLLMHAGPQLTLASLRQKYWPIDGRRLTRSVLRKCLTCIKARPTHVQQLMGDLPPERIDHLTAFNTIGVDFAGPIYIKQGVRKTVTIKAYVAVFVCFSTKAVHLEGVSSLHTDSFIAAFRRMIARRGLPHKVFSDNGTTFVGADRELKRLWEAEQHQQAIQMVAGELGIEWNFLPPRSPHHGGLHEAAVKSFKHHFVRVVGDRALTFEGLATILCQIEAVLNSRPLVPTSDNPDDLHWISPSSLSDSPQNWLSGQMAPFAESVSGCY